VLFVDDEPDARMLGSLVLCRAGARVHEASSAEEALESLGDKTFDVVVSDLGMPRMDGFDLMRSIRGMVGPISRVRSLALTAFARAEDKRRAIDAGFDQHLAKPADPAVLIAEVAKLVSLPAPLPMH
jgi:CheY-like chemotaxis protein